MNTVSNQNIKDNNYIHNNIIYIIITGIVLTNIILRVFSDKSMLSDIDIILGMVSSLLVSGYINFHLHNSFRSKNSSPINVSLKKTIVKSTLATAIITGIIDIIINKFANYQLSITIQIFTWSISTYIVLSVYYKKLKLYGINKTNESKLHNEDRITPLNKNYNDTVNTKDIASTDVINEEKEQIRTINRKRDLKSLGERIEKDKKSLDIKTDYSIKITTLDWKSMYNWDKLDCAIAEKGPVVLSKTDNYITLKPIHIGDSDSLVNCIDKLVKDNLNNLGNEYYYKTESQLELAINKCVLTKSCFKIVNTIDELESKTNIESFMSSTELQTIKDSVNRYLQGLKKFKVYYTNRLHKLNELQNKEPKTQEDVDEIIIIEKELILNTNIANKLLDDFNIVNNCLQLKRHLNEFKAELNTLQ